MGANHSQPMIHQEERKPKRSLTLSTLFSKSSSRLNLLGHLGRRSPQPPPTPVTPHIVTVVEVTAEQGMASPVASATDPEDRPEMAVEDVSYRILLYLVC